MAENYYPQVPSNKAVLATTLQNLGEAFAKRDILYKQCLDKYNQEYQKCVDQYPTFEELKARISDLKNQKDNFVFDRPKAARYINFAITIGCIYGIYDSFPYFQLAEYGSIFLMMFILRVALCIGVFLAWRFIRPCSNKKEYKAICEALKKAEATRDYFKNDGIHPEVIRKRTLDDVQGRYDKEWAEVSQSWYQSIASINFLPPDLQNTEACQKMAGYLISDRADNFREASMIYQKEVQTEERIRRLKQQMEEEKKAAYIQGRRQGYRLGYDDGFHGGYGTASYYASRFKN